MTSRNSFWASSRENHKRRVWVWIVAVLSQLLAYGGITMIYLSRIKGFYAAGSYRTQEEFQKAMYQAAKDALGFSDNLYGIIFILGTIIGIQGFSYLYDRRKVDVYHSVPVSKSKRFAVIYVNGLLIYLAANLSGLLLGTAIAASQGAVNAQVLASAGLAFLWNLAMFLAFYHMMILAVMLTGNRFVTLFVYAVLVLYELVVDIQIDGLKRVFFKTYSAFFLESAPKFSVAYDITAQIWELKNMTEVSSQAKAALPLIGKWCLIALAVLGLAYFAYRKRASETAGQALAYPFLKPLLKVAVVIPAALMIGRTVYDTSYSNEMLQLLASLAGGLILCAALEVLYDFDIRSLLKHLPSSGVALAGVLAVFCIFKWDLIGYDSYIPAQNKIESVAISSEGYYDSYWDENANYIDTSTFVRRNMFLTDAEPVLALVDLYQQTDEEEMADGRTLEILYRLKSGREVARCIRADYEDPKVEALMNRILGTESYKKGVFQAMTDETSYDRVKNITYTNGAARVAVPIEDALRLRAAWIKDMEQYDFTLARHNRPCGQIRFEYGDYTQRVWTVYDSFENTIACLKEREAYYPAQLDAKDIDNITVTCYHNELNEDLQSPVYGAKPTAVADAVAYDVDYTVQETFYEEEQIEQILPHIHSSWLYSSWCNSEDIDRNYSVQIIFKKDTAYPYERDTYFFNYEFLAGQVPDFVAEATAYTGGAE